MEARGDRQAFGGPGIEPRWSHSNKEGVGTAYSADSRLWFTLWRGIVTEVYYHRIDRPQMRDLQFLVSDGSTFFHEEKRDLATVTTRTGEHALAYRTEAEAPGGGYTLRKDIITDPHQPCLLVRTRLEVTAPELVGRLRLYVLAAPHLNVGGWGNTATVYQYSDVRSWLRRRRASRSLSVRPFPSFGAPWVSWERAMVGPTSPTTAR